MSEEARVLRRLAAEARSAVDDAALLDAMARWTTAEFRMWRRRVRVVAPGDTTPVVRGPPRARPNVPPERLARALCRPELGAHARRYGEAALRAGRLDVAFAVLEAAEAHTRGSERLLARRLLAVCAHRRGDHAEAARRWTARDVLPRAIGLYRVGDTPGAPASVRELLVLARPFSQRRPRGMGGQRGARERADLQPSVWRFGAPTDGGQGRRWHRRAGNEPVDALLAATLWSLRATAWLEGGAPAAARAAAERGLTRLAEVSPDEDATYDLSRADLLGVVMVAAAQLGDGEGAERARGEAARVPGLPVIARVSLLLRTASAYLALGMRDAAVQAASLARRTAPRGEVGALFRDMSGVMTAWALLDEEPARARRALRGLTQQGRRGHEARVLQALLGGEPREVVCMATELVEAGHVRLALTALEIIHARGAVLRAASARLALRALLRVGATVGGDDLRVSVDAEARRWLGRWLDACVTGPLQGQPAAEALRVWSLASEAAWNRLARHGERPGRSPSLAMGAPPARGVVGRHRARTRLPTQLPLWARDDRVEGLWSGASAPLPDGTTVLAWALADEALHLLGWRGNVVVHVRVDGAENLRRDVELLRALAGSESDAWGAEEGRRLASGARRRLAEQLLAPLDGLLEGAARVVVVPGAGLVEVPIAALTWHGAPLIHAVEVVHVPALATAVDVTCAGLPPERVLVVRGRDHGRGALDEADAEHREVTAMLGSRVRHGRTRAEVLVALDEVDAMHLVGHGEAPRGGWLSGGMRLDGGVFRAVDVLGRDLRHVRVVVLSGCHTAVTGSAVEPHGGFVRAMLAAGVGAVIATHGAVRDDVARRVACRVWGALLVGSTVAAALAAALRAEEDLGDGGGLWAVYGG